MTEQLLKLPEKPGTVIAIGEWWLIRLRPYEGAPSAWELLPLPSKELTDHAKANGVSTQCVYGDDWVLAEAEQEGGYLVISDPRDSPSGIQYWKQELERAADPEPRPVWNGASTPPIGSRVQLRADPWGKRGEVVGIAGEAPSVGAIVAEVRWDEPAPIGVFQVGTSRLEPEREQPDPDDQRTWPQGIRVTLYVNETTTWHGVIVRQLNVDETEVLWDHDLEHADAVFPPALRREEPGR